MSLEGTGSSYNPEEAKGRDLKHIRECAAERLYMGELKQLKKGRGISQINT